MRVSLALLADYANVSQEGKLNVLGIFDSLSATSLPTALPQCYLVLRLVAEPEEKGSEHQVQFRLSDPDGRVLLEVVTQLLVPEGDLPGTVTTQLISGFANLRFESYGPHEFQVLLDGAETHSLRLDVRRLPGEDG